MKNLEASWAKASNYVSQYSDEHAEKIWRHVHELPLSTLNDPLDVVPDYEQEDLVELRSNSIIIGTTKKGKSHFLQKEANRLGISYDELLNKVDLAPQKVMPDKSDKTLVEITPRYKLERYLILNAISELSWTGIELSEKQMIEFLAETGVGARILDYNEVETTIREDMMDELANKLLGESRPTNGSSFLNKIPSELGVSFSERLRGTAIKYGYKVNSEI